jgi:hypothetical protein
MLQTDILPLAWRRAIGPLTLARLETIPAAGAGRLIGREYCRTLLLTGGARGDVEFYAVLPGYLTCVSVDGEAEIQVTSNEGRLVSSPALSAFFAPATVQGVSLAGRFLAEPRFVSGVLRVMVRNTQAIQQAVSISLHVAELVDAHAMPPAVTAEYALLSTAAADGIDTGVGARASATAPATSTTAAVTATDISVSVENETVELLAAQPSVSVEIRSLSLSLDGDYPGTCLATLAARSASGSLRRLRVFRGLAPGASMDFSQRDGSKAWFTLNPGESLVLQHSSATVGAALFDGLVEHVAV